MARVPFRQRLKLLAQYSEIGLRQFHLFRKWSTQVNFETVTGVLHLWLRVVLSIDLIQFPSECSISCPTFEGENGRTHTD
jgi:hypothetical protein